MIWAQFSDFIGKEIILEVNRKSEFSRLSPARKRKIQFFSRVVFFFLLIPSSLEFVKELTMRDDL